MPPYMPVCINNTQTVRNWIILEKNYILQIPQITAIFFYFEDNEDSFPVKKFLFSRDNLSSPTHMAFRWYVL